VTGVRAFVVDYTARVAKWSGILAGALVLLMLIDMLI
jgi:hypothetical protein